MYLKTYYVYLCVFMRILRHRMGIHTDTMRYLVSLRYHTHTKRGYVRYFRIRSEYAQNTCIPMYSENTEYIRRNTYSDVLRPSNTAGFHARPQQGGRDAQAIHHTAHAKAARQPTSWPSVCPQPWLRDSWQAWLGTRLPRRRRAAPACGGYPRVNHHHGEGDR